MDEDLLEVLEAMAANGNPGAIAVLRRIRTQMAPPAPAPVMSTPNQVFDPFVSEQAAIAETRLLDQDLTDERVARKEKAAELARIKLLEEERRRMLEQARQDDAVRAAVRKRVSSDSRR